MKKFQVNELFYLITGWGWANTYLKKAGLISSEKRGYLQITEKGKEFLNQHPDRIKVSDLKKIDEFREFYENKNNTKDEEDEITDRSNKSPEEIIDSAHSIITKNLIEEIISSIKKCSPQFFEKMVLDVLIKMGYGWFKARSWTCNRKIW